MAGQTNVGKSTIVNLLTDLSQHVGNWPDKTVEREEGVLVHNHTRLRLIDLPGTYSLTAHSLEERVARDFIIQEQSDVIVMVADASSLELNLYLLAELLILSVPVVLALNILDVAENLGIKIEAHVPKAALGLPVVPIFANRNQGMTERIAAPHRRVFKQLKTMIVKQVPSPFDPDWVTLKLLEGNSEITRKVKDWGGQRTWPGIEALLHAHEDAVLDIASGRYAWSGPP